MLDNLKFYISLAFTTATGISLPLLLLENITLERLGLFFLSTFGFIFLVILFLDNLPIQRDNEQNKDKNGKENTL